MSEHKKRINMTYEKVQDIVFKTKEKEKDVFFRDRLEGLTDDEKDADTILKSTKLGLYSKGLKKSLTTYDRDDYDGTDEERSNWEKVKGLEQKLRNKNRDATDGDIDDAMDEMNNNDDMDRENNHMRLGEYDDDEGFDNEEEEY